MACGGGTGPAINGGTLGKRASQLDEHTPSQPRPRHPMQHLETAGKKQASWPGRCMPRAHRPSCRKRSILCLSAPCSSVE